MRHSAKSFYFFFENFLCRVPTLHALGKAFFLKKILCRAPTRKALGKELLFFFLKIFFAECQASRHSAKIFYFFFKIICRASTRQTLGKELLFFLEIFFAECHHSRHSAKIFFKKKNSLPSANTAGTRQSLNFFLKFLCRVL